MAVSSETRRITNRGVGLAQTRMHLKYPTEWANLLLDMRKGHPELSPGARRARAHTIMRRRHAVEWWRMLRVSMEVVKAEEQWKDGRAGNGPRVRPRPTLDVLCPVCGLVGVPCRGPNGRSRSDHAARRAALAAAA